MLQSRSHVVFPPATQLINLQLFQLSLVLHLALKQVILGSQLLNFTLHLRFQTLVFEIFHFERFLKLSDLQLHQTSSIVLRPPYLIDLLDHFSLMTFLLPPQLIRLIQLHLVTLVVQFGNLVEQSF